MYYNVAEVESATQNLAAAYPNFSALLTLPETSADGHLDCHALRIGIPASTPKPAVLVIGGLHADEWGSCEIAVNLAADLLHAVNQPSGLRYGARVFTAAEITQLLTAIDVIVFPLVNPDGRLYSQTHQDESGWRKNRRVLRSAGGAIGVDLNRNFDFLFRLSSFHEDAGVQATDDASSVMVYQGPHAFSEPETRNVRRLLDDHPVHWLVDLHAGSRSVQYVWGDDETQTQSSRSDENFLNPLFDCCRGLSGGYGEYMLSMDLQAHQSLAARFVQDVAAAGSSTAPSAPFTAGPTYRGVPYCGTSHDYAYSRHLLGTGLPKVLGFCVEWNELPQPAWVDMPAIIRTTTAGLIGFCQAAAAAGPP
jgi:hypothetical protein